MAKMTIYSTGICPVCERSKKLLTKWQVDYEEIRVDLSQSALKQMLQKTNRSRRVPQFLLDGEWIGGFDELTEYHMEGKL